MKEMYTAAFDAGTTALKGVVLSDDKHIVFQKTLPLETICSGGFREQDPRAWHRAFCELCAGIAAAVPVDRVRGIIMSGQMQDLIPVDREGEALGNAILYSDGRAEQEAAGINDLLGADKIREITGNGMDGSIPAAKLLWLREHEQERYRQLSAVLGSSKDYLALKLTGRAIGDYTAASTFGLMDIHRKRWDPSLIKALAVDPALLPDLLSCGERAGTVSRAAAAETGLAEGTPVYAGAGDAGASTLSAGITMPGEYNIYLGTSGWIAAVSDGILSRPGVFNLAAIPGSTYINVVPFLNAGAVHKWISGFLWREQGGGQSKYDDTDALLEQSECGSGGLLVLPYLAGERFPVMDPKIRGACVGLGVETSPAQMARACLEGVAFSIRQGLEALDAGELRKISLVGGGVRTEVWRRIFADVLQRPVAVPKDSSEYLPAAALCAAVFIDQGLEANYESFLASLPDAGELIYRPSPGSRPVMEAQYERYLKLYPALKTLFS